MSINTSTRRAIYALKQSRYSGGGTTLAEIIGGKQEPRFTTTVKRHEHHWIGGHANVVCTKCGMTVAKPTTDLIKECLYEAPERFPKPKPKSKMKKRKKLRR